MPLNSEESSSTQTTSRTSNRQGSGGPLADNSALEAEAAQQAVNYHRVRRRVQEDIRKSLLQNPVIRRKLQGPRVLRQETIAFLSSPAERRQPAHGFSEDAAAIDWIHIKADQAAKKRHAQEVRDQALREYKEEQARELNLYRMRLAKKEKEELHDSAIQTMIATARTEFANKQIASRRKDDVRRYATDRKARLEHAQQLRSQSFNTTARHKTQANGM